MGQRLFVVSMIRNEADILGQFLLHCAELFDHMIFVDHNSTDNSDKIIQSFQLNGMPIATFNFRYQGYYQSLISTEMCKRSFDQGADWVFFLDADEFLEVRDRAHLESSIESASEGLASFHWKNCIPAHYGTFKSFDLRKGFWKPKKSSSYAKIAMSRRLGLQCQNFEIATGNHAVAINSRDVTPNSVGFILHFPVRSESRLACKVEGGIAACLAKNAPDDECFQWFELNDQLKSRSIGVSELNWIAANYGEHLHEVQSLVPSTIDWELDTMFPIMRHAHGIPESSLLEEFKQREAMAHWKPFPPTDSGNLSIVRTDSEGRQQSNQRSKWPSDKLFPTSRLPVQEINLRRIATFSQIGNLARLDNRPIPQSAYQVPAFMVVRDEILRLGYALKYHRSIGVDGFFIVDNGSTDGTLEYLLSQPDVHVYVAKDSYRQARNGIDWVQQLLTVYASNKWALIIDADEYFVYQNSEAMPIPMLCQELDSRGLNCFPTMFLDMYSDLPILQTSPSNCATLLDCCPFFDSSGYYRHKSMAIPSIYGGIRARLFWPEVHFTDNSIKDLMSRAFDEQAYLDMHSDVCTAVQRGVIESGFQHFITWGMAEGRDIKLRDVGWTHEEHYLKQNPDVGMAVRQACFASGLEHFIRFGQFEGRSFWSAQLPLLTQVPLVKWHSKLKLQVGRHDLVGAHWQPGGSVGGVLLHFKLMNDLASRARVIMAGEDNPISPAWTEQNDRYYKVLQTYPTLSAISEHSLRYTGSAQLVQNGLMIPISGLGKSG